MDRRTLHRRLRILILLKQICFFFKNKEHQGAFKTLFHEMRNDRELLFRYFRMSPARFDHLLTLVREQMEKKDTAFRKSFPAVGWLAITLHYLAYGETQQSFDTAIVSKEALSQPLLQKHVKQSILNSKIVT